MPTGRFVAPVIGALIGLLAFSASLGLGIVNPSNTIWLLAGGDHRIHFLGWHMFRHDAWQWPPGAIANYGYPVGTSIAYTDSIPAFAFPFKIIRSLFEGDMQYFGLWLLLSHVLQGVFAVLLLRTRTNDRLFQIMGAAFFVMSPPLVFRFGHPALTAQWLLLAGLYLYFGFRRFGWGVLARWAALACVAAATHPYIAMMVLVLALAHHGHLMVAGRSLAAPVLSLSVIAVSVAAVFWLSGYFVVESGSIQSGGLGVYSMNLLALVMPSEGSTFWGPGPFAYATLGQYEGYAYFGLGALMLLAVVIVTGMTRVRLNSIVGRHSLRHLPLVLCCTLLVVMALSPRVTASGTLLFAYDDRWWGPLTVFRASGRMFWPVFYLLLFGVLMAVMRWFRRPTAVILLVAAAVVQAVDLVPVYARTLSVHHRTWDDPLQSGIWSAAAPHYRHLLLAPTNMCDLPPAAIDYAPFALLAGRAGLTLNSGFAARFDVEQVHAYCQEATQRFRAGDVRDDELYVLRPDIAPALKGLARRPVTCVPADGYDLCFTTDSYRRWHHAYDIARQALPAAAEIERFRAVLESMYRDELGRPQTTTPRPPSETSEWITRYLASRLGGCAHEDATRRVSEMLAERTELPFCSVTPSQPMPSPAETLRFRLHLDTVETHQTTADTTATHVDAEGEAVWLQEYLRLRLSGRSETEATEDVRSAVRAIAAR